MTANRYAALSVCLACSFVCAPDVAHTEEPLSSGPATPAKTVAQLFDALQGGDVNRAVSITDPVNGSPDAATNYYRRLSESVGNGEYTIVGHLQLKDTALVIFREFGSTSTTIDLDPAFLVRRGKEWRVLLGLTQYDRPDFSLDARQKKRFQVLKSWFKEQKPTLKTLIQTAGT